jgi:hypothetical protein
MAGAEPALLVAEEPDSDTAPRVVDPGKRSAFAGGGFRLAHPLGSAGRRNRQQMGGKERLDIGHFGASGGLAVQVVAEHREAPGTTVTVATARSRLTGGLAVKQSSRQVLWASGSQDLALFWLRLPSAGVVGSALLRQPAPALPRRQEERASTGPVSDSRSPAGTVAARGRRSPRSLADLAVKRSWNRLRSTQERLGRSAGGGL